MNTRPLVSVRTRPIWMSFVLLGFALLSAVSAVRADVPAIDVNALVGLPVNGVAARFKTAGYIWKTQHDNRYLVRVAAKRGGPTYTCIFSPLANQQFQIAGPPVCREIKVSAVPGQQPAPFRTVAPPDWTQRQAYVMYEIPTGGLIASDRYTIVLMQKRKDGNRVAQVFPILQRNAQITLRENNSRDYLILTKGWEDSTVEGSFSVELIGPRWHYNNTEDSQTTRDVTDPCYFYLNWNGVIVPWVPGTSRDESSYDPDAQWLDKIAAQLVFAVRNEDWKLVRSLFATQDQDTGVATCRKDRELIDQVTDKSFLTPTVPKGRSTPQSAMRIIKVPLQYVITLAVTPTTVYDISVDSRLNRITNVKSRRISPQ